MFEQGFENVVYNCDCLDLMKEMVKEDVKVDCIITDPPYLIDYKTNYRKNKDHKFCKEILNDNNPELIKEYVKFCYSILNEDSALYMFCNADKIDFFKQEIEKYFTIKNIIIWVKNNWTAGDLEAQYGKQYEIIIYANKGRCKFKSQRRKTDVWFEDKIVGTKQIHQNEKPVNLICEMISNSTNENDLIFDGFGGSFSTYIACHKMGRRYLGAELDKEYFDKGSERLNKVKSQISFFD